MVIGLDEVRGDVLAEQILMSQQPEPVAADLADELRVETTAPGPDRHVGSAASGGQQYLAIGVTAVEQFRWGTDEHVPGEVAKYAEGAGHDLRA